METLTRTRLLLLIEETIHDPEKTIPENCWQDAWEEFLKQLSVLVGKHPASDIMRVLEYTHVEFETLQSSFDTVYPRSNKASYYCAKALGIIDCELHILMVSLAYPGIASEKNRLPCSPLHLSKNFNLTDLVELIAALYELGVFCEEGESKMKVKTLVKIFEIAFNVSLENYNVLRAAALNRKIKTTSFLDRLTMTFENLSQQ